MRGSLAAFTSAPRVCAPMHCAELWRITCRDTQCVREATTGAMRKISLGDSVIRVSWAQHPVTSDGPSRWLGFAGEPSLTPEGGCQMAALRIDTPSDCPLFRPES